MADWKKFDFWSLPALALWGVFFVVGFFPELTFETLRSWGKVVTQTAAVNSFWVLILAQTAFMAAYVYIHAQDVTPDRVRLQRRTLFAALLTAVAFLPMHIESFRMFANIPIFEQRLLVYAAAGAKCFAWLYLGAVVLLYHTPIGPYAFYLIPSGFLAFPDESPQQDTHESSDDPTKNTKKEQFN